MLQKFKQWWFKEPQAQKVFVDAQIAETIAKSGGLPPPPPAAKYSQYDLCEKGKHEYGKWQLSAGAFFQRRYCKHCNYCQEKTL